jgi:hypothetical protein
MLQLGAILVGTEPERVLDRPKDVYTDVGRDFWAALVAGFAAIREDAPQPTIKQVLRVAGRRRGSGG